MHNAPDVLHETPAVVSAGSYCAAQGHHFPPHSHTHWELVYYRTGQIRCAIGDSVFDAQPGTFLLTSPGITHSEQACTAYSNYFIGITTPPQIDWPRVCFDGADQDFRRLCEAIVREWQGQAMSRNAMLAHLVGELDLLLQRAGAQKSFSGMEHMVEHAEALLRERYAEGVTIAEIASEVGASPSTLRATFAHLRGQSPQAYLSTVKIQNALALLRHSTLTLDVIASLCGFHSASHLSRYIKRETGQSPGALRPGRNSYGT